MIVGEKEEPQKNLWTIFSIVAVGVFMSTLDSSMVNIALPTIMEEFGTPLRSTEWVVLIYLLTITASLLICGHFSDHSGRKKVYSAGLFIFAAGSLACAYAPGLSWLILARFGQALGAAMMMSTGPAIIKENFPAERLGRSLGMIGVSVSCGLMTGPVLGGYLMHYFSWRAIFLVTVPIGLVFSLMARAFVPDRPKPKVHASLSTLSMLSWVVMLVLVVLALSHATSAVWSGRVVAALLLPALAALAVLIYSERRAATPLLPPHLLKQRFFYSAVACAILSFMVLFSVLILTPFFLDRALGLPKARIGLIMMAVPLTVLVVAPLAGWLSEKVPAKILSTLGLLISTGSLLWLSRISQAMPMFQVVVGLSALGCGQGLFLSPNSASVLGRIRKQESGKAAALLATARNLGMLLGIGQASLVFSHYFGQLTGGLDMKDFLPLHMDFFVLAMHKAFLAAVFTGALGVVVSFLRDGR